MAGLANHAGRQYLMAMKVQSFILWLAFIERQIEISITHQTSLHTIQQQIIHLVRRLSTPIHHRYKNVQVFCSVLVNYYAIGIFYHIVHGRIAKKQ